MFHPMPGQGLHHQSHSTVHQARCTSRQYGSGASGGVLVTTRSPSCLDGFLRQLTHYFRNRYKLRWTHSHYHDYGSSKVTLQERVERTQDALRLHSMAYGFPSRRRV